ncbi:MAG: hypothetical protein RI907_2839 [Pseudomonadota bacterium]|jgi:hypothetical protein
MTAIRSVSLHSVALATLALGVVASAPAHAYKFNALSTLSNQGEFRQLSEDLAATFADKPQAPAAGLGVIGFDVSVTGGTTSVKSTAVLEKAAGGHSVPKSLPTVGLRVEKGLPFDVDLGASYVLLPGTSASALSGDVKWAFWGGGLVMPAVATRVFYTQTNGLGDMSLNAKGIELSVSKGFAMFTPYAGVGVVASTASTKGDVWKKESFNLTRTFVGLNANFLLMNLGLEADKTGKASSINLKLGMRF